MHATGTAFVGLGANLGNPQQAIRSALTALAQLPQTRLIQHSSLYLTAPMQADGDDYVNAVAELHTQLGAELLLQELQQLEQQFGRLRSYQNAPRTLDCDLLLFDGQVIHTATLQVPHPRMHQRAFVLFPLAQIAPAITIPGHGPIATLLPLVAQQTIQKLPD